MMKKMKSPKELKDLRESLVKERTTGKAGIVICGGTGCRAYGCEDVFHTFERELRKQGLDGKVDLKLTGCHGFCECGTLVVVYPEKTLYVRVSPEDVPDILSETVKNKKVIERLLYTDPVSGEKIRHEHDIPFYHTGLLERKRRGHRGKNGDRVASRNAHC